MSELIRLNGFTRKERNLMISNLDEALGIAGGWVLDYKMFSNKTIVIVFELARLSMPTFYRELKNYGLKLTQESEMFIQELIRNLPEQRTPIVTGTLQINFIHNDPDLRIEVPAVPG